MKLHWKIIIGLVLGVVWALLSSYFGLTQFTLNWINPFGTIFINLLKLIAIPLILFSIIKGVAELSDIKKLGAIGFKTLGLYIATTLFAVAVGLSLVNLIKPGKYVDETRLIKNRLAYDEKAIALIEQQSTQVATNQQSPNNNSATDYDTPSEQNLSAVAAYESIGNLDQRDKIKQVFGVDLLA